MNKVVLDVSLMAKWFLSDEELQQESQHILNDYVDGKIEVVLPRLAVYEMGNILFVASVRKRVTRQVCKKDLENFSKYPFEYIEPDYESTMVVSLKYGISFYDSVYVTLASDLKIPLVTGDNRLWQKTKGLDLVYPLNSYH
jgi:predicted nucleic acid-binding protein